MFRLCSLVTISKIVTSQMNVHTHLEVEMIEPLHTYRASWPDGCSSEQ